MIWEGVLCITSCFGAAVTTKTTDALKTDYIVCRVADEGREAFGSHDCQQTHSCGFYPRLISAALIRGFSLQSAGSLRRRE